MKNKIIIIGTLILYSFVLFYIGFRVDIKHNTPQQIVKVNCIENEIDSTIRKLNIKFPHILKAQIVLESGFMLSTRAIRDNNLTGMKVAKTRPTTAINKSGHAIYNSIEDCIVDYALWQSQNAFRCKTEQDYFELLGRIYAEDPKYIEKLKQILQ